MKALALVAAAAAALLPAAQAAARPGGSRAASDLTLVSPAGPVVNAQSFAIVLHSDTITQKVKLESGPTTRVSAPDANGDFHFAERVAHGGTYDFEAYLAGGTDEALLEFSLAVQPKLHAIQSPGSASTLRAPGCRICVVHDPRGDTRGGPPDLESFSVTYSAGWISIAVRTYDSVRFGDGQHPCVEGWTLGRGRGRSVTMGCFTGPHTGNLFGGCLHPDRNGDCGSAHMAFPNGRTVTYRFRAAQLNDPAELALQVWILYPGDRLMDTVPNVVHLGNAPTTNCYLIVQTRTGGAGDYEFGRSLCAQAGVVVAKP